MEEHEWNECKELYRSFDKKDNKKTWLAGMLPLECKYGRELADPEDKYHEPMSEICEELCETAKEVLEEAGDTWDFWHEQWHKTTDVWDTMTQNAIECELIGGVQGA